MRTPRCAAPPWRRWPTSKIAESVPRSSSIVTSSALAALVACGPPADWQPIPLSLVNGAPAGDLAALGRAIGDRRIVLLGENGHGVGEFSRLRVRLVEWLRREKGFEVVAFESGFHECDAVNTMPNRSPRSALLGCLAYAFHQAELLPLFAEDGPQVTGIDIQAQGYDSQDRPGWSRTVLAPFDSGLARRVARQDSLLYLPEALGGLGDAVYPWLHDRGELVAARYDSAAELTSGTAHWSYRMSRGLVDRLRLRADAKTSGAARPARYFELRDEWMARTILAIADSIAGPRKVVVLLHNDHARLGAWTSGNLAVRAAGGFLRQWVPDEVFSVGLFMGKGTVTDNGRTPHDVLPPEAGSIEAFMVGEGSARYLLLTGNRDPVVRAFADSTRPYYRIGYQPDAMVPADEFDALVLVDSVGPPDYRIPPPS